jgi:hypothetical protein
VPNAGKIIPLIDDFAFTIYDLLIVNHKPSNLNCK